MEHILKGGGEMCDIPFLSRGIVAKPRDLARTLVAGAGNQPPVRLSVAIEGGSSVVKRGRPSEWLISDHGRWRQMHLGAIDAAYGATPYFRHLYPEIEEILMSAKEGSYFLSLANKIHKACLEFIEFESIVPELIALKNSNPDKFRAIYSDFSYSGNAEMAFIDVIFKRGKDSVLSLLPAGD